VTTVTALATFAPLTTLALAITAAATATAEATDDRHAPTYAFPWNKAKNCRADDLSRCSFALSACAFVTQ